MLSTIHQHCFGLNLEGWVTNGVTKEVYKISGFRMLWQIIAEWVYVVQGTTRMYPGYIRVYTNVPQGNFLSMNVPRLYTKVPSF